MQNRTKKEKNSGLIFGLIFGVLAIIVLIAASAFFWMNPKSQSPAEVIASPAPLQSTQGVGADLDARGVGVFTQVSAGGEHACALDAESVKCWGGNGSGQTNVPSLRSPNQVSAGANHTCAIDVEGLKCWGANEYGKADVPKTLQSPTQVSAGGFHTCAIDAEGVKCWGYNKYGQTDVPKTLKSPTQIKLGHAHTCVIDEQKVKCWGAHSKVPDTLKSPTQVSAGANHTCAIDAEGLKCWGDNEYGQTDVPKTLKSPTQVSAGFNHTCAIDVEGVKCWGKSDEGQTNVPKTLKSPTQVSAGFNHTCAIDVEGVECWGNDQYGKTLGIKRSCPSPKGIAVLSVDLWSKSLSKIPAKTLESLRKEVRQYNQEMLAQYEEQHGGRAEVNRDYCGVSNSFEERSKKGFSQITEIRDFGVDFFAVDYFEVLKDHSPGIDVGEDARGVLLVNRSDFAAKLFQGNVEMKGDFLVNSRILSQTAHAANFLGIWLFDPKSLELIHQEDSPSASHWGTPEIKVISTSGRKIKLSYTYTEPSSHECSESGFAYTKTLRTIELACPNMPRTKCARTQSESEKQKACAHD
jgi:hypothetical protein